MTQDNNALAQELEARAVISKLVMCARTSGGTAGPDQGLIEACEDGEMWLAKYPRTPAPTSGEVGEDELLSDANSWYSAVQLEEIERAKEANEWLEYTRFEGPFPGSASIKEQHKIIADMLERLAAQPKQQPGDQED